MSYTFRGNKDWTSPLQLSGVPTCNKSTIHICEYYNLNVTKGCITFIIGYLSCHSSCCVVVGEWSQSGKMMMMMMIQESSKPLQVSPAPDSPTVKENTPALCIAS